MRSKARSDAASDLGPEREARLGHNASAARPEATFCPAAYERMPSVLSELSVRFEH